MFPCFYIKQTHKVRSFLCLPPLEYNQHEARVFFTIVVPC